jgi:hypothetical protein
MMPRRKIHARGASDIVTTVCSTPLKSTFLPYVACAHLTISRTRRRRNAYFRALPRQAHPPVVLSWTRPPLSATRSDAETRPRAPRWRATEKPRGLREYPFVLRGTSQARATFRPSGRAERFRPRDEVQEMVAILTGRPRFFRALRHIHRGRPRRLDVARPTAGFFGPRPHEARPRSAATRSATTKRHHARGPAGKREGPLPSTARP